MSRALLPLALLLFGCKKPADDVDERVCAAPITESWRDNPAPAVISDAFADVLQTVPADGVAWAILVDGEVVYAGAAGDKDATTGEAMLPTTLMHSGSTLKMQTAAAVLVQQSKGELSLDDTLGQHLPDFDLAASPGLAPNATLHELLSHQGGFYDYTPIDGPSDDDSLYEHAHEDFADTYWMLVAPGSFYNYSNPNFSMAGLAMEEATSRYYRDIMRQDLWQPLCMDRSFLSDDEVEADGDFAYATTTNWTTGVGSVEAGPGAYDHAFSRPAGFAWSNVIDMLRFANLVLEGDEQLLPGDAHLALSERHVDTLDLADGAAHYGYGLTIYDGFNNGGWREDELWTHNGAIPGYSAELYILPGQGISVAVLANGDGSYFGNAVATVFSELAQLPAATDGPANTQDASEFGPYEGVYDDPLNTGELTFAVMDGVMTVAGPDLDAANVPYDTELTPLGAGNFLWTVQGFQMVLTFVHDGGPDARWVRSRFFVSERRSQRGPRQPADAARVRAWADALSTAPWDGSAAPWLARGG